MDAVGDSLEGNMSGFCPRNIGPAIASYRHLSRTFDGVFQALSAIL